MVSKMFSDRRLSDKRRCLLETPCGLPGVGIETVEMQEMQVFVPLAQLLPICRPPPLELYVRDLYPHILRPSPFSHLNLLPKPEI